MKKKFGRIIGPSKKNMEETPSEMSYDMIFTISFGSTAIAV